MSGTEVIRLGGKPSLRARGISKILGRASSNLDIDLANNDTLLRMRDQVQRLDWVLRRTHYSWYFGFFMRSVRMAGISCRQIRPTPALRARFGKGKTALLYVHGGGFFFRTLGSHARLAASICRGAGISRAYLPLYRLAPEHKFPAALEDIANVYRELLAQGYQGQDIVMAGDSAGGGILLSTLMHLRDENLPLPACGVLLSPVTDLTLSGESYLGNQSKDPILGAMPNSSTEYYHGDAAADDPLVSPLFGDFAGFPPLLVQVGSRERLLDDSLRLKENADAAGNKLTVEVWNRMPHVWQLLPMPESKRAVKRITQFIRSVGSTRDFSRPINPGKAKSRHQNGINKRL